MKIEIIGAESLLFFMPVPHDEKTGHHDRVMMIRIEDDKFSVRASDIQLLDDDTVDFLKK